MSMYVKIHKAIEHNLFSPMKAARSKAVCFFLNTWNLQLCLPTGLRYFLQPSPCCSTCASIHVWWVCGCVVVVHVSSVHCSPIEKLWATDIKNLLSLQTNAHTHTRAQQSATVQSPNNTLGKLLCQHTHVHNKWPAGWVGFFAKFLQCPRNCIAVVTWG